MTTPLISPVLKDALDLVRDTAMLVHTKLGANGPIRDYHTGEPMAPHRGAFPDCSHEVCRTYRDFAVSAFRRTNHA